MVENLHWCAGLESNQRCFSVGDLQSLALATRHTDAYGGPTGNRTPTPCLQGRSASLYHYEPILKTHLFHVRLLTCATAPCWRGGLDLHQHFPGFTVHKANLLYVPFLILYIYNTKFFYIFQIVVE